MAHPETRKTLHATVSGMVPASARKEYSSSPQARAAPPRYTIPWHSSVVQQTRTASAALTTAASARHAIAHGGGNNENTPVSRSAALHNANTWKLRNSVALRKSP